MPEQKIIPAHATIKDLCERAEALEKQSEKEAEPLKTQLHQQAEECREWIRVLRTGKWQS